ncbi:MAG: alpha-L-fucosidase [Acidimicrobiia bacterium]
MSISAHAVPEWFTQRRYGMFVHMNIATVPAFAPVHEYADWYRAFWEPGLPDIILHPPVPLPEVVAFHREHFPEVRDFDDFIPQLTFDQWDADAVARLAVDAGMRYLVPVTKHHDGFCWWDTDLTTRTSVRQGPHRDVIAELADAAGRHDLVFGLYYSLLDWGHPDHPDRDRYVDAYMRRQLADLVERFRPQLLWGDGHWGHNGAWWRADQIVEDYYAAMQAIGLDGCVNDRFSASHADYAVYEYDVPEEPPEGAWELCRGLSYSFCFNRAERDDDHLSAPQLVAMLTEVVAKGGNLLLNIGPKADGSIPDVQARVLRDAGTWVNAHAEAIHGSRPFAVWGDDETRYTVGRDGTVFAIDLTNATERAFPSLAGVAAVDDALEWVERDDGLHVRAAPAEPGSLARVYRVRPRGDAVRAVVRRPPLIAGDSIAQAIRSATAGDVVAVPTGIHQVAGVQVPEGVTVRGEPGAVLDGGGSAVLELTGGSRLERLTVIGGAAGYMMIPPTCVTTSGDGIEVRDCTLQSLQLGGGRGHQIIGNEIDGGNLWAFGCDAITVRSNRQHGLRWGVGLDLIGGADHVVEDNDVSDDLCGIRLTGCTGSRVSANRLRTRWWGVHLRSSSECSSRDNQVDRTMRAQCVEGGTHNTIAGNLARRCDSSVLVEQDATNTVLGDNRADDCRIDTLVWEST